MTTYGTGTYGSGSYGSPVGGPPPEPVAVTLASTAKKKDEKKRHEQRRDGPRSRWHKDASAVDINSQEFAIQILYKRGGKKKRMSLDRVVESVTWDDSEVVMAGSMEVRKTEGEPLRFAHGDMVICSLRSGPNAKHAKEVWRMRVGDETGTASTGQRSFELVSPIDFLRRSKDDWKYKKEKEGKHKEGWKAHEITKDVCRKYGVRVGKLATPKYRIKNLVKRNASPIDVIVAAYTEANKQEGRKYVVEYEDGEIHVKPLRYSRFMYELGGQLIEATLTQTLKEDFATELTVSGTADTKADKKGKGKIEEKVIAKRLRKRYGKIHRTLKEPELKDAAAARRRGRRELRKAARRHREMTLSVPGLPLLRRGHAIRLRLPELNMTRIIFVKTISHTVAAGSVQSEVTVGFVDEVAQLAKCEKKCRKAQERDRQAPKECNCQEATKKDEKKDDRPERNATDGRQ